MKICLFLIALLMVSCRSSKGPMVYQPVFDQTRKVFAKTPDRSLAELDIKVLIRSNLKSEYIVIHDTIMLMPSFVIRNADLKIDLEILNEKPPIVDTLLVLSEFLFRREWADLKFPKQTDSVFVVSDPFAMGSDPSELFSERDIFTKPFLTINEIKMFQNRDFSSADSVFAKAIGFSPYQAGDTIPFEASPKLLYYEGNLLLQFDTIFIHRRIPIPQFTLKQLVSEQREDFQFEYKLIYNDAIEFKRFYANEEDIYIDMVKVQGGTFKMGSNEFDEDERPAMNLKVSDFLISKWEITNKLYCFFLNDKKVETDGTLKGTKLIHFDEKYTRIYFCQDSMKFYPVKGFDDYPVVNVTWSGAQQFAIFANGGLPTEKEWEYAARGGVFARRIMINWDHSDFEYQTRFAGSDYMGEVGAFVDNSRGYCHPVGSFLPNELGIHDMSGNVWEWCVDIYENNLLNQNGINRNQMMRSQSGNRVVKGGSWSSDAMYCRITNRSSSWSGNYNPYLGFRFWKPWTNK